MALQDKVPSVFEEDEDLEALRWAALQTLKQSMSANIAQEPSVVGPFLSKMDINRGGVPRSRHTRHTAFQRHRINSNLIAIVPVQDFPAPGNSQTTKLGDGGRISSPNTAISQHKFAQHRNSRSKGKEEEAVNQQVSTKFTRFDDSSAESSIEESEDECSSSEDECLKDDNDNEPDPDILVMKDEDDDSLERLMDKLEQEMNDCDNRTITSPIENHSVSLDNKKDLKKLNHNVPLDRKSDVRKFSNSVTLDNLRDTKKLNPKQLSASGLKKLKTKKNMEEPVHQASVVQSQNTSCNLSEIASTSNSAPSQCLYVPGNSSTKDKRTNNLLPKSPTAYIPSLKFQASPKHHSPSRHYNRRSRSKSPSKSPHQNSKPVLQTIRKSRSISPRLKSYYSSSRSPRHSRSPRRSRSPKKQDSRSPIRPRSPRSPRNSRSPLQTSRSPRRRYSSPVRYNSSNHPYVRAQGTFSPRRQSLSPRSRRPISPRRSVSPRSRRLSPRRPLSPRRSPVTSRRQLSPRRQSLSPRFRRQSKSPVSRHPHSPRSRRSVSPRRPSPISFRRRFSPSPSRRNQSPPRRFSPPRRNPSPPRRRSSRSISRSPRRRSPMRDRSPLPPRTFPRSPSPRRRASRSPVGRSRARRSSPVSHKLSPWSSPRQQTTATLRQSPSNRRYSTSPGSKRKSLSPYGRQKRRSISPSRRSHEKKPATHNRVQLTGEARPQNSPRRGDSRKPAKESRNNNMHTRSRSPRSSPVPDTRCIHNASSPSPSPQPKSCSCTSSLSLSPSPERNIADDTRRMKSPLRINTNSLEFKNNSVGNSYKDGTNDKDSNPMSTSPLPDGEDLFLRKQSKCKPINKEPKSKSRKKIQSKGKDLVFKIVVASDTPEHHSRTMLGEMSSPVNETTTELPVGDFSNASVMEARRRKFESSQPVELSRKKIRLRLPKSKGIVDEDQSQAVSTTSEFPSNENDELDVLLDLEIDKAMNLWSSEDSLSDNESRFKTSGRSGAAAGEMAKMGVLPFTKLLAPAPTLPSQTSTGNKETKISRSKPNRIAEERSRRLADRGIRGQKQRSITSGTAAPSRESREQRVTEMQDNGTKIGRTEITEKGTDSWNIKLKVPNTSESKSVKCEGTNTEPLHGIEDGRKGAEKTTEHTRGKEGDLRAELSRRRAERLTKVGSLHEILPARLVRSAFKDAVGTKNFKKIDRGERHLIPKKTESNKGTEKSDGRRVLVLKSTAVEHRIPSISVTIPKESKHKETTPGSIPKLPVRLRLGLPTIIGDDREGTTSRRRGSRKVKLKRNVTVTSGSSDKV